jgi:hypothetical protein
MGAAAAWLAGAAGAADSPGAALADGDGVELPQAVTSNTLATARLTNLVRIDQLLLA